MRMLDRALGKRNAHADRGKTGVRLATSVLGPGCPAQTCSPSLRWSWSEPGTPCAAQVAQVGRDVVLDAGGPEAGWDPAVVGVGLSRGAVQGRIRRHSPSWRFRHLEHDLHARIGFSESRIALAQAPFGRPPVPARRRRRWRISR